MEQWIRRFRPKRKTNYVSLLHDNVRPPVSPMHNGGNCKDGLECCPSSSQQYRFNTFGLISFGPLKGELGGAVLRAMTSRHTECVKVPDASAKSFTWPAYSASRRVWKSVAISKRVFVRSGLKLLKGVHVICVNLCIILITFFSEKEWEALFAYRLS